MHRRVDAGPVPELLLIPFLAVLLMGLLTPSGMASSGDPGVYFDRAVAVLAGLVPFRDFSSEYPPLSLIPMTGLLWLLLERAPGVRLPDRVPTVAGGSPSHAARRASPTSPTGGQDADGYSNQSIRSSSSSSIRESATRSR